VGHNGGGVNDPGRIFAFEWLLRLLHGLSCWLAGRGLALDSVIFPYQRPAHADDYALIFTEDSRFAPTLASGVGTLVASFNANLLDLPIRRDEAALTAFLDGAPGKITTLYRRDREMVIRVRDLLRAALPATLSLDDIADRLHLSPRTIHRRLEEEGSSFRGIKDALRRDMALARLTKTKDSIAESPPTSAMPTPRPFTARLLNGREWRRCITGANGRTNWPARIDDVPTSPQSRPTSWRP
jgi:AraC-like DNA-binding protein